MSALAKRQSALGTAAQIAPRFWPLIRRATPTWHLADVDALTPAFVTTHRIAGLIWDVDGTLTSHHGARVADRVAHAFNELLRMPELRHVILSNANDRRFRELGKMFPEIPVIRGYRLDGRTVFQSLLAGRDAWSDDIGPDVRDALVIRKPSAELVQRAVHELGCARDAAVVVGDQYLTDIAGAALAGIRSIKLPTIDRASFPPGVRVAQRIEQVIHAMVHPWRKRDIRHPRV